MRFQPLFILIALSLNVPAWATGGDGCYCTANGYLAYERWQTGDSDWDFSLFVVPYAGPEGILPSAEVPLPAPASGDGPNAVNISCGDQQVFVWLKQGDSVRQFSVDVSDPAHPRLSKSEELPTQDLQSCSSSIYGNQSEPVGLPSGLRAVSYELIKDHDMGTNIEGQEVENFVSRVVEKGMNGDIIDEKVVYQATFAP